MTPENTKHPLGRTRAPVDDEKARSEYEEYLTRAKARREAINALRGGSAVSRLRRRG